MDAAPTATYRLQLHPEFGFADARALIPYLKALGISHVYTSPYLQAAKGSTHGYDVVNPASVNEELGGEREHRAFCEAIQEAGMHHLIDIVPNHMAIGGKQNPWWWDVLQNGEASPFATFFDVDWETTGERWHNRILLPVLGDHYGRILEAGELQLHYLVGYFELSYYDHVFPIDPTTCAGLLRRAAAVCGSAELAFLADSHARIPRPAVVATHEARERHRDKAVLAELLARLCKEESDVFTALNSEVRRLNQDIDALDRLIDQQNYRLAYWRVAMQDLGYRRFFDITDLAGMRIEHLEVFHASHALPVRWVRKGWVQGMRVDHPDGLRDPAEYFRRLRRMCPNAWLLAEKILEPGEHLPDDWPIHGTTGYDFLNAVGGLFVDGGQESSFDGVYREFTGQETDYRQISVESKREVLEDLLGSELNRLTNLFVLVCERHRRFRDYTRQDLRGALLEAALWFPVYRSYVSTASDSVSDMDRQHIQEALEQAHQARQDIDPELLDFLGDILRLRVQGRDEAELALRFQQLSGPAMAKGIEDTAFYRYIRLLCLNEVGGAPDKFGWEAAEFHEANARTQQHFPHTMLAGTTHDTKRSEDVRARLAVLSEMPAAWGEALRRWRTTAESAGIQAPDTHCEYLLYQTLVGAWPITEARTRQYFEKANREAKLHTSWTRIDEDYEAEVNAYIAAIFAQQPLLDDLASFVDVIAFAGYVNSLAQLAIRLMAPGVPDIYQGTELWDLSLVDPDNRRPVDYEARAALFERARQCSAASALEDFASGLPKLWLLEKILAIRHRMSAVFGAEGVYEPLYATGEKAEHVVAFTRGSKVLLVVPRLVSTLAGKWQDTRLTLPPGQWCDALAGQPDREGSVRLDELLEAFPVAVLIKQ